MPEPSQTDEIRSKLVKYAGFILNLRPYFRNKLREKLILRCKKLKIQPPMSVIEAILDDLSQSGYLNDQYLAEAYVRRQLSKGYGAQIISLKLRHLGVDTDTIKFAIETQADSEAQIEAVRRLGKKYSKIDPRRLVGKLYSRGFPQNIINKVFDGGLKED